MKSSILGTALGADIGYGNLKISVSNGSGPHEVILPAGAQRMSEWDASSRSLDGGEAVLVAVDGVAEEWVAGIEPKLLNRSTRVLNDRYTTTPEYAALFSTGLIRSGVTRIDALVTGLPVSQFWGVGGEELRASLKAQMVGRHHVNTRHTIEVMDVVVVPQPMGTFTAVLAQPEFAKLQPRITSLSTLCVDVGFFSVDFVLFIGNRPKRSVSNSSTRATSYLLDEAARRLSRDLGRAKSRDVLDEALRSGRKMLEVGITQDADFLKYIRSAAAEIAPQVMAEIRNELRSSIDLDLIILTGGGADFYVDAVKEAFPGIEIAQPENPVLANARGFRILAEHELKRRMSAKAA